MPHNSNTTSRKARRVRWGVVKTYYQSDIDTNPSPPIGCYSTVTFIGYPQFPPIEYYFIPESQLLFKRLLERKRIIFDVLAYNEDPPPPTPTLRIVELPEESIGAGATTGTTYGGTRRSYLESNQPNNTYTTSTTGGSTSLPKCR